jgi:hypothetical protein
MGLPTSESHMLIWKELHRANTVAYFRTDGNHLLARFGLRGMAACSTADSQYRTKETTGVEEEKRCVRNCACSSYRCSLVYA